MIFPLVLAGFAALMLGTYRQSVALLGTQSTAPLRRRLVLLGYALLAASLVPVAQDTDWPRLLVEWFGDLTAAALLAVGYGWWRHRTRGRS